MTGVQTCALPILLCAFAGVVFALREGFAGNGMATLRGDVLGLAAGMLWGLTTLVIRASNLSKISAEKLLFYQLAVSAACFPLLSLALGEAWVWRFSPFAITSLFLQTVVGAFASYLAWMWMLGRYPATKISAEKLLFYQLAVSALCFPLLSLALGEAWVWQFSPFAITSLLLQTVVGAFASYLAWMWMLGRYPATKISVFVFLTPLFALLFGALWLKESVTLGLVAALGAVAVGIVLVNRQRRA